MPYPTPPSRRMAWDADGTVFGQIAFPFGVWTDRTIEKVELNDEDEIALNIKPTGGDDGYGVWLFPELREFDGIFLAGASTSADSYTSVDTSPDTTNGQDGVWTQRDATPAFSTTVMDNYRTGITSHAVSGVRGVRYRGNHATVGANRHRKALHLYGDITPGQTPDRLLFIDETTGLEFTIPEDWGDAPRGGSEDREWRIKNNSAALTATTIQYTAEALYLGSASWYTFTLPGGSTYQSVRQIASIAPATTTGIIKTRRIIPATEGLGLHVARVYLNTDTWA